MRRPIEDLSRWLLHRSVARLTADREVCSVCRRTPLVGERIHLYSNGAQACSLCRDTKREQPERSLLVHHSEWGHAVKPVARPRIAA
jgi:hypothetical protein